MKIKRVINKIQEIGEQEKKGLQANPARNLYFYLCSTSTWETHLIIHGVDLTNERRPGINTSNQDGKRLARRLGHVQELVDSSPSDHPVPFYA